MKFVADDPEDSDDPFYPLLMCQGDCDDDDECSGDLVCFDRSDSTPVPGCSGDNSNWSGRDFCTTKGAVDGASSPGK